MRCAYPGYGAAVECLRIAQDPLIAPHPVYLALGADPASRATACRTWLQAPPEAEEVARIRAYMTQEKALGAPRFQAMVEKALDRPAAVRPPEGPRGDRLADAAGG
ncbi:hypothetical protein [Luteimonas saliphila]|uniref:hypothetical protein n=1 Tax=Luteimonas saliphila TaxID=2804919 RepID=UPI00192DF4CB|nr:hypothetical protein [Luteimonas saliphila]